MWRTLRWMSDALTREKIVFPCGLFGYTDLIVASAEELDSHLKRDFYLFTYREHFEGITARSGEVVTTDEGWGCLLRSLQMLLAHYLKLYGYTEDKENISLFYDSSHRHSSFSLHNVVYLMFKAGRFEPVYWSPSQGCEGFRRAARQAVSTGTVHFPFSIECANDGILYAQQVRKKFEEGAKGVLLLVSLHLGVEKHLSETTLNRLRAVLKDPTCIGGVGGVANRAYYFFGYTSTGLLYLDPHLAVGEALGPRSREGVTPGADSARCVSFASLATSFTAAFALNSSEEWELFQQRVKDGTIGLFTIEGHRPIHHSANERMYARINDSPKRYRKSKASLIQEFSDDSNS